MAKKESAEKAIKDIRRKTHADLLRNAGLSHASSAANVVMVATKQTTMFHATSRPMARGGRNSEVLQKVLTTASLRVGAEYERSFLQPLSPTLVPHEQRTTRTGKAQVLRTRTNTALEIRRWKAVRTSTLPFAPEHAERRLDRGSPYCSACS